MQITTLPDRLATARVSAKPVALARIVIGLAAAISGLEAIAIMINVLTPEMVRFPYGLLSVALTQSAIAPLGIAWVVFALAFTFGFSTRFTGFGLAATIGFILSTDQRLYSNHFYLLALIVFLLTLADCGAICSLDARRRTPRLTIPVWPLIMLKGQFTIVYLFAALTKVNGSYLSGDVIASFLRFEHLPLFPNGIQPTTLYALLAWVSIVTEFVLAAALWFRRTQKLGLLIAIGFHTTILLSVNGGNALDLTIFGSMMICLYALFSIYEPTLLRNLSATSESPSPHQWGSATHTLEHAAD